MQGFVSNDAAGFLEPSLNFLYTSCRISIGTFLKEQGNGSASFIFLSFAAEQRSREPERRKFHGFSVYVDPFCAY